jgi:hypothetical protein
MDGEDEHAVGYLVLPRGTPVEAADGVQVGTFDRAIDHVREHILDGIVLRTKDGRFFVDAPEVARMTNRRVLLTIDSGAIADLPRWRRFRRR